MNNIFLKKAVASMLNVPKEQIDAAFEMAEKFNDEKIDKNAMASIINKLSKKTPEEINSWLKFIDNSLV